MPPPRIWGKNRLENVPSIKWRIWIKRYRKELWVHYQWVKGNPDAERLVLEVYGMTVTRIYRILELFEGGIEEMLKLPQKTVLEKIGKIRSMRSTRYNGTGLACYAAFKVWLSNQYAWEKKKKRRARSKAKNKNDISSKE